MAWLNKVNFTNFPDLAGAVNKISESVKNIEKISTPHLALRRNKMPTVQMKIEELYSIQLQPY